MKSHVKILLAAFAVSLLPVGAYAQDSLDDDDGEIDEADGADYGDDGVGDDGDGAYAETTGDGIVTTTDYSESNPTPPNSPVTEVDSVDVAHDAGVGSELAYASQSVLEIGGALALFHQSETTALSLTPFIGYFIIDGLQLSLLTQFSVIHISGNDDAPDGDPAAEARNDFTIALLAEPSYHLAITEAVYVFLGLGFGVEFNKEQSADFIFRPRLGADLLVGRSAIFKPAIYTAIGAADGFAGLGVEASFSAMW